MTEHISAADYNARVGRRASGEKRNKRNRPEQELVQRPLVEFLRYALPDDAFVLHIPNGGARSAAEAAIMRGLGVMPGAADLLVVWDRRAFFLELKAPGEPLTPRGKQREFWEAAGRARAPYAVVDNWLWGARVLRNWGIPLKVPVP